LGSKTPAGIDDGLQGLTAHNSYLTFDLTLGIFPLSGPSTLPLATSDSYS
jgi:hypothetical protein